MHAPLIIDVAGLTLSRDDRRRLAHPLVGGVILFGRNWSDRAQLIHLVRQIRRVRRDLLVAVDHEGGRVQRFRTDGFTHLPPMARLGARWPQDPGLWPGALDAMNTAMAAGFVMGAELRACDVDLTFAPVLDLDHGRSGVIGDRSFGRRPEVVAALAQALIHGLRQAGLAHCGKHFPGHGYARADTHLADASDPRDLDALLAEDAAPYGWLSSCLDAVMPAHVVFPMVDARPAGFSARWLQEVLRQGLGFQGAVFSDDLSMVAARRLEGRALDFSEAAWVAMSAGVDMVLLCNQSVVEGGRPIDEALASLDATLRDVGGLPDGELRDARRRALLRRGSVSDGLNGVQSPRYRQALERLASI